jgi:hypothetical protein
MKKLLLLGLLLTSATLINAQAVIFSVEEPANIQGAYEMTFAPAGADWTVMADLEDPANAIQRLVEFVDDGTAADSLGCNALTNDFASEGWVRTVTVSNSGTGYTTDEVGVATTAVTGTGTGLTVDITVDTDVDTILTAVVNDWGTGYALNDEVQISSGNADAVVTVADLAGKIAVVYRGECEFGTKAFNAQNAGADGVVIINNVPGEPVGMAAGIDGPNVEIPTVMIEQNTGALIRTEVDAAVDVEVFIGSKLGFYDFDLGTVRSSVMRPNKFAMFDLLTQDDSDFSYTPQAMVYNYGAQDQTNVNVNVTIELDGNEIYNENATPEAIVSGDSALFVLPPFSQASYDLGYYEVNYTITSDDADDYLFDNEVRADFAVSDEFFSLSQVDTNDAELPLASPSSGRPGGEDVLSFESCVVFDDPNASRVATTGLSFSAYTSEASGLSLDGIPIDITASIWEDNFIDLDDPNFGIDQINELDYQQFFFTGDPQGEVFTVNFEEPIVLQDNQRYLFCVTTFEEELFFGYDRSLSYQMVLDDERQPFAPVVVDQDFFGLGFGAETVPAIGINLMDAASVSLKEEEKNIRMIAYPSPASDVINVDFQGHDVTGVELYSIAGQMVQSQTVTVGQDLTKLDVQGLENGMYIVRVKLANGMTKAMNVVVGR